MHYSLIQAGDVGLNLAMLVSWEWNAASEFLVIHLLNDTLYLRGAEARALWLLLDTLAAVHVGATGPQAAE